ncbi:hypothetical protein EUGRSUZ_D00267 [Eucalyptus grandis]|uniref:Uncharacterized protein n=2 Tax=Eucalyptus grandis TaxID=71139 RepID=A0ACC3L2F6_EUCGR|nr:hypothetical protein EUGRSUZ_D00267 [Eucalyptus grandis]
MACCRCCCRQREDERAGPHFFKIILSDTLDSGKLGIPRRFLKKYGNHLSSLAFLKVSLGSNWPIELKKCNNGTVWLQKGWREFMEYYSIGHGHLIVFKYEGDSTFRAIIFDKSTSEIDYSSSSGGSNPGPVFRGPTHPRPLTRLELANKFESEHPFFKVVMPPSSMKTSLVKFCFDAFVGSVKGQL